MCAKKVYNFKAVLFLIALIIVVGISISLGMVLLGRTFIAWWIPALVCGVPALVTAPLYYAWWARMLNISYRWMGGLVHAGTVASIILALFMGLNYWGAPENSLHEETAVVVAKQQKKRTRYRYVRHRAIPNGTYTTYHVTLELPDGQRWEKSVSLQKYLKMRKGKRVEVEVGQGLFHFPIVKKD